jgi:8-oxo-dGTP pyrophosphatase MutT (NUDIX family)
VPKDRVDGRALTVRGIALGPDGSLILIARRRAGRAPYLTFPGGHVEDSDRDLEAALRREVAEELAAGFDVCRPVADLVTDVAGDERREVFYVIELASYSATGGDGPEWRRRDAGNRYEVVTRTVGPGLVADNLQPTVLARRLETEGDPRLWPSVEVGVSLR